MAAIELGYAVYDGAGHRPEPLLDIRRIWRRWRLLSRLRRRNAHRANIAMGMDERQLVDLGLDTRRRRYDWIGQLVTATMAR